MRCRCCNKDMIRETINEEMEDGFDDLCGRCISFALTEYDYVYDHEHILENATEGAAPMRNMEHY